MAETDVDDIVSMTHRLFREARDHSSGWRQEAEGWYKIVSGEQWDEEDLTKLQREQRPAVTFNRVLRTVNAICGTQIQTRQETRYIPRELGDIQVNEVLTSAADWVRDQCDAEDEESDSFRDMTITGMGWVEKRLDQEQNPEGDILYERVNPLEMYWDPGARKKNLSDRRWQIHLKTFSAGEFEDKFPGHDVDLAGSPWEDAGDDVNQRVHVYPQDAYKETQGISGQKRKTIQVAYIQWAAPTENYRVGKSAETVSKSTFAKLQPKIEESNIKYMKQGGVTWKRAVVAGHTLIEEGDCPCPYSPTFQCMTYERDQNRGTWFGVVKAMVDPQKFGNKFFSVMLDIYNKGSKGGVMAEVDAVEDFKDFERKWARPDGVVKVRQGAISQGKIQPKPSVQLPPGMDRLMGFSLDAVHEVTGINLELLGFANREQAGVLEQQRKQAGLTIIAGLFDAMRRYRKEDGRVLLHLIQTYISDGRLIRVLGKNGKEKYVQLAKQSDTAEYDVIVDESPTSPNVKEKVFGSLVQLLPVLGELGIPMPPELLDYAPLPASLSQKWKELLEGQGDIPPELQKQIEEGKQLIEKLSQENQQLKTKQQETMMQIQAKQQEAQATLQLKQQETQATLQFKQQEAQADMQVEQAKMESDSAMKQREIQIKERDAELELQAAEQDARLDRWKAEQDAALEQWKAEQTIAVQKEKVEGDLMVKVMSAAGNGKDENGIDLSAIRRIFRDQEPRKRTVTVTRGVDGLIESADIMEAAEEA